MARGWPLTLAALCWVTLALGQGRPATLSELKRARNAARDAHHDVFVRIGVLQQEISRRGRELAGLTKEVRALQADPPGVLRNRNLQEARQRQNRVARQLATLKVRLRAEEDASRVRRLQLVGASWAWVARLLETADRAWRIGRTRQAHEHTDQALRELERLESLEALDDAPREPFEPQPLDPDAGEAELAELNELYEALLEGFEDQVKTLLPEEKKLQERVSHLDRLARYAYAIPTLGRRLERAQADLERVSGMRRNAETRAQRCRAAIQAVQKALVERGLNKDRAGEQ